MGKFTLKKSSSRFFRVYVEMMRPFLNGVTDRECDVLGEIVRLDNEKKGIENVNERMLVILSTDSRKKMCQNIGISGATLRNALVGLKRKGLLTQASVINKIIRPEIIDGKVELIFNFELIDD